MSDIVDSRSPTASLDAITFSYDDAFSRNLGWLTEWEQQLLRRKRIAIAGMGGVGGVHLLTLARLGVGGFNIADPDRFELVNFNRQAGATFDAIGRSKVEVMAERALQINPELRLTLFRQGVDASNLDEFLSNTDLFIDALDFFALEIRREVNARCAEQGIPVINAAPLGMGTAFLVFKPGSMTFEEWFRLDGLSEEHQYVSYLLGMAPSGLHRSYLVDPSRVDLRGHRGPSTAAACELCAGVAAVEAVKLLLGRGRVRAVPFYHHFDAYTGRWVVKKLRGGNRHPRQRLRIALARPLAARLSRQAAQWPKETSPTNELEAILNLARWAPSGDNLQPWRFELVNDDRVIVHVGTPSDVYDYNDGEPTLLSAGCLLETLKIAATGWGRRCSWHYLGRDGNVHRIAVDLPRVRSIVPDELLGFVKVRSVDRGPYRLTRLTSRQRETLTATLGDRLEITWDETPLDRWRAAVINGVSTDIRLRIPEAYAVHRRILDWEHDFSSDRIPARAIGLDPVTARLTRWAMRDWRRVHALNKIAGTALARLEMDWIPGLFCAAHFTISGIEERSDSANSEWLLATGQKLQRFWLTATSLGLAMQPTLASVCFGRYGQQNAAFTTDQRSRTKAARLARLLQADSKETGVRMLFRGRIGLPIHRRVASRSARLRLDELLWGC